MNHLEVEKVPNFKMGDRVLGEFNSIRSMASLGGIAFALFALVFVG